MCLGLMPDPGSGKPEKNLPVARHLIDMLEVLQQKTEGNRTPEESEDIEAMLYQLRMAYVQVECNAAQSQKTSTSGPGRKMGGASCAGKPIPGDLQSLPSDAPGLKGTSTGPDMVAFAQ